MTFSEFGRRISENGSQGTDHGAAAVMMVMGGRVNGGLYGTAPTLNLDPATRRWRMAPATCASRPTSAPSTRRSSTAGWAATRAAILGADFRKAGLDFV